jgi:hypothetical protein
MEELMSGSGTVSVSSHLQPKGGMVEEQATKIIQEILGIVQTRLSVQGSRPGPGDVISWWYSTKGLLLGDNKVEQAFDWIDIPKEKDETVVPMRMGPLSMASMELNSTDTNDFRSRVIDKMTANDQRELAKTYYVASLSEVPVFSQPLRATIASDYDLDITHGVDFMRIQLPGHTPNGNRFILSYCFPI